MKKYIILFLSIVILSIAGCTRDYDLNGSVFIEDEISFGLPEYSEWGYNTFGAYIDRKPFVSDSYDLPAKIIVNTDTLNLILTGIYSQNSMRLEFSFIGYSPQEYKELTALKGQTINLKENNCFVTLTQNNLSIVLEILDGNFTFKNIQNLLIDEEQSKSIISGTFNFKYRLSPEKRNEVTAVSNGRFDLGIGYDNFYNL